MLLLACLVSGQRLRSVFRMYGRDQLAFRGKKYKFLNYNYNEFQYKNKKYKNDLRLNGMYMLHICRLLYVRNIKKLVDRLNQSRPHLNSGLLWIKLKKKNKTICTATGCLLYQNL